MSPISVMRSDFERSWGVRSKKVVKLSLGYFSPLSPPPPRTSSAQTLVLVYADQFCNPQETSDGERNLFLKLVTIRGGGITVKIKRHKFSFLKLNSEIKNPYGSDSKPLDDLLGAFGHLFLVVREMHNGSGKRGSQAQF